MAYGASGDIEGKGLLNALLAKVDAAQASLDRSNTGAASGQLQAFINQVQAQRNKAITVPAADDLIAEARWILANL